MSKYGWMTCEVCGALRMRTKSGTVCPNGHGKIHPPITTGQMRTVKRHRWAATLPQAKKVTAELFKINGCSYFLSPPRRGEFIATGTKPPTPNGVFATLPGKSVRVRLFIKAWEQTSEAT